MFKGKTTDVNKATKLLADYEKNNYNAYKTLIENGYAETTAKKASRRMLSGATKAVARSIAQSKELSTSEIRSSLEILGVSREDVVEQLNKIAFNQRDYGNALKVLGILAKDIGISLETSENMVKPVINIGVERVNLAKTEETTKEPDTTA